MKKFIFDISMIKKAVIEVYGTDRTNSILRKLIDKFINEFDLPICLIDPLKYNTYLVENEEISYLLNNHFHVMAITYSNLYMGLLEILNSLKHEEVIVLNYDIKSFTIEFNLKDKNGN